MANEWMNHPDLKNLDPIKLQLIRTAAANAGNKTGKDLAPVMILYPVPERKESASLRMNFL